MEDFIVGILLGSFITIVVLFKYLKNKYITKNDTKVELRRGLYYNDTITKDINTKLCVTFEITELEKTSTKSKIKIDNVIFSSSNDLILKDKIIKLVDNSWIHSNKIEWIDKPMSDIRKDKLDKLLK